jgi:outer membrane protein
VKNTRYWATLVAALLAVPLAPSFALAQQPQQPTQQVSFGPVAIIDMSYIFKNHARFKAASDRMRQEVLAAEEQLKARRTEIENLVKQLETFKKDSPDYKQLDTDITKKKIDLNAAVAMQKKEFVEREAKLYYNVYQEVLDATQLFAERYRIALVLRFNGDAAEPGSDPQDILKQLNKQVVYYHKSIDITPYILQDLNRTNVGQRPTGVPLPAGRRN